MKYIIIYLAAINLTGFFIMGIDKRKARKQKWRVPEKTLFTIAGLFGSIGILAGMRVFRHKTKHRSFTIGVPAILILQILLVGFIGSWYYRHQNAPSRSVERELSLITHLDTDTICSFLSYDNLIHSNSISFTDPDKTAAAAELFFQNFKYHITNESVTDDTAVISVKLTNIDMHALAVDLCTNQLKRSVSVFPDESNEADDYDILIEILSEHSYPLVDTTAEFHLEKQNNHWVILSDESLEDALVGGFLSCMNDPFLLPASDVLKIHLDAMKDLTGEQWQEYMGYHDIFATYNETYRDQIDLAYGNQIANCYDYKILSCEENDHTANTKIALTSISMEKVLTAYETKLLAYAASTQSLHDDTESMSDETARLLLDALKENTESDTNELSMEFYHSGTAWEVRFDSEFTKYLMGNMEEAMKCFNE